MTISEDVDIIIITNRFATKEFAAAWAKRAMASPRPVYRKIGQPYHEGVIKYAPIAVDCEQVIPRRDNKQ